MARIRHMISIESLEHRVLFVTAPPTLLGITAVVNVTGGAAPLAASGSYTIEISTLGREYKIIGGKKIASSDGTYSYGVIKPKVGELKLHDSIGGDLVADLNFIKPTSGTLTLTRAGGGAQTGTFSASGPDFAFLQGNVLIVRGTTDGDTIGVNQTGPQVINVTRNNITQTFDEFGGDSCIITGDAGNDRIDAHTVDFPTYVDAGPGNDNVSTGPEDDTITGGAGRNTLAGNDGNDRINGSGAADLIFGGSGADRLYGNGGNDTLDGGGGVDRLFGGDGDDFLLGGGSNDKLHGDAGNDTLIGGTGSDSLDGGSGSDKLFTDSAP